MKFSIVLSLLVFYLHEYSFLTFTTLKTTTRDTQFQFNAKDFLVKFGYDIINQTTFLPLKTQNETNNFQAMIKLFQVNHGLQPTGQLDTQTERLMKLPRCGVPDIIVEGSFFKFKAVSKWSKKELTFRFINYTPDLGRDRTRSELYKAFKYWSDASDLTFREVSCTTTASNCKTDLIIEFGVRQHGDAYAFDGKGSVLAHAFFPQDGRIHFDDDEFYVETGTQGINLHNVAAHEIGHALGLDHSSIQGALMFPSYQYFTNLKLHEDDILGIQSLYGKSMKKTLNDTQTLTSTRHATTTNSRVAYPKTRPRVLMEPCEEEIEAMFLGPQKTSMYILIEQFKLWRFDFKIKKWSYEGDVKKLFEKIEYGVRGGVQCNQNFTWFFKGLFVWSYQGNRLRQGFPKQITDPLYPRNPYTAVHAYGRMYLLKGIYAYLFDTAKLRIIGHGEFIGKIFNGIPTFVKTTIKLNESSIYFFKDDKSYKYNLMLKKLENDYPKWKKQEEFFKCSQV